MEATPTLLLAMWASGVAAGGAVVSWWRIVGRGYVWLTAGVVAGIGTAAALIEGGAPAWGATALAVLAALRSSNREWVVAAFGLASLLYLFAGSADSPALALITGSVFLGGVTTEMLLGHWFLIDPTLPRWSLTYLAIIGGAGLIADAAFLATQGTVSGGAAEAIVGWAYLALGVMTALLILGVIFSLREPSYTGVMAATGLSYLAVLTAFGVVVLARMLAA